MGYYGNESAYEQEILELHREHQRERDKLELRLGALEETLAVERRKHDKTRGEWATRAYAERLHEAIDTLLDVVKLQNSVIEQLAVATDFCCPEFEELTRALKQVRT